MLGDDHPNTLVSAYNLAGVLRDQGRLKEAEALGAEAVRGARAKLVPSHPFRLAALRKHGNMLAAMRRCAEAGVELLEAHETCVEARGHDDRRTKTAALALIDVYDAWHEAEPDRGCDAKAAEWRARLPQLLGETEAALP